MTPPPPRPTSSPVTPARSDALLIAQPVTAARPGLLRTAGRHFWGMQRWKKVALIVALLVGTVGAAGSVAGMMRPKPVEVVEARQTVESLNKIGPRSSLTNEQQVQRDQAVSQLDELRHWFFDKTAPQLWRIGLGFALAFVLGYMARQFLKTVSILAAVVLIGGGVAIYLGFLDLAKLRADAAAGTGWAMDRLDAAKEQIIAMLGASISGTAGFVVGFLRGPR